VKSLSSLNKYLWKYRRHLLMGIVFVILTNYFRILSPQLTGYVVNSVVNGIQGIGAPKENSNYDLLVQKIIYAFKDLPYSGKISAAALIIILAALISGIFMFLMRQTIIVMSRHIEFEQKNEIYAHYQSLEISFYKSQSTGDLMNRITEDVSRVRSYTGPAIMYIINLAAIIAFSIFFMVRSDPHLTMIALFPLPILAITIYLVNTIINRKGERIQSLLSDLTTNAQESFSGIRVIKSFVQENAMFRYFSVNSEAYRSSALSLAKTEAIYFPSMGLLIGLSTLITILVGGLSIMHHEPGASVGKIAEFVMYIQMLTFPVSAIGWTASMVQRAATSQKRINEFLHIEPSIQNKKNALSPILEGNISFRNADFTYAHTGIHALKNFSLDIKKGEKIAIVGRTGSGKSTLAQLLLRMYDVQNGNILLDDIPIADLNLQALRSQISYVPQDVFLFSDSIKNNICFGAKDIKMDAISKAADQANILKEIESFPDGFETIIGERGVTLSGGQKQRISIARALIKNPGILIFDDCLSAVDTRTEKGIARELNILLKGKTAIITTHRIIPSFGFDRILVLDDGRIVEQGTHEELLRNNGLYADLFAGQQFDDSL